MIHVCAPGTLMLMGEHAVLHGSHALVATADLRLHVFLTPRQDRAIHITSQLGSHTCTLDQIELTPPFGFALAVIQHFSHQLQSGFDLVIESDLSPTVGLGSSAAILSALTYTLLVLTESPPKTRKIDTFTHAYQILLAVQGCGSGADLAACIEGGILCYRKAPLFWSILPPLPLPITLVYAGYKTPTSEVIAVVEKARSAAPQHFATLFSAIDQAVLEAKQALLCEDRAGFVQAFTTNQHLMVELGVVDHTLTEIVDLLEQDEAIMAAKVSGSGLGDCVIGLGKTSTVGKYQVLPLELTRQGVIHHDH